MEGSLKRGTTTVLKYIIVRKTIIGQCVTNLVQSMESNLGLHGSS